MQSDNRFAEGEKTALRTAIVFVREAWSRFEKPGRFPENLVAFRTAWSLSKSLVAFQKPSSLSE